MELQFYIQSVNAVATQGALLLGFAFAGLVDVGIDDIQFPVSSFLFYLSTEVALASELVVLAQSTLLIILGENLALRGPPGSMPRAVETMRVRRKHIFNSFGLSLVMFHVSAISLAWVKMHEVLASISTIMFAISLYMCYKLWVKNSKQTRLCRVSLCLKSPIKLLLTNLVVAPQ
eukprot:TRINITY_DN10245_c0_g1_i3.p1 TRINITY_DN10245_c0_g1~~TRINITY_DN10245_c0_g1_i3.p1  ORF type:complete len:198 (-),score=42.86 TRINITY_DN10245_c0_g1_i3:566-1090(-)